MKKRGTKMKEIHDIARELFLTGEKTQQEIADMLGISNATVTKWVNDNGWKEIRGSIATSQGTILRNLLLKAASMSEDANFKADEFVKLTKSIQFFSPNRTSVSAVVETMRSFMSFVYEENLDIAKQLQPISKKYVDLKIKEATNA